MRKALLGFYQSTVLAYPKTVILLILVILALLAQSLGNLRLDASSDSLVLENDKALQYYREVVANYDSADILMLTYAPQGDLFSDEVLADISQLREDVMKLNGVKSILSIVDVPLTQSPPVTLAELNGGAQTLLSPETDRELARLELRDSQLYRKLLVNDDFSTTALVISLAEDPEVVALHQRRNALRLQRAEGVGSEGEAGGWNDALAAELEQVSLEYQLKNKEFQNQRTEMVQTLRDLMTQYQDRAKLFLGGVAMIVADSIQFIQSDLLVFGSAAFVVIVLILVLAFRQLSWVVIPLVTCFASGFATLCVLAWLNWPISVVSSNFIALLLIITLSLNIHLIVRFRELAAQGIQSIEQLARETVKSKFQPCIFTSLTTMVAFASLIVSGIRPVIDFGWIMCIGIFISFVMSFTLFPSLVLLIKPRLGEDPKDNFSQIILTAAQALQKKKTAMSLVLVLLVVASLLGVSRLTVENRFIDYFKPDTEIYQGMVTIDEELGGTTPLDIIIDAPPSYFEEQERRANELRALEEKLSQSSDDDDDFFDDFENDFSNDSSATADEEDDFFDDFETDNENAAATETSTSITSSYWFNAEGVKRIKAIHESLEAINETGKVLSLASSISLFENLKDAKPMDDIDLGFLYQVLSDDYKKTLFAPYLSKDGNQVHINIRVFESQKGLNRDELLQTIRDTLTTEHGIDDSQVNVTGLLVMYNNMLHSLFNSQILTLGAVFIAILLMFIALFRNFRLALITILPNLFSAGFVLGLMGLTGIPLDLMTITIAAISVGIAVDNSIHYIHRFKDEFIAAPQYQQALDMATINVGRAMFYTTLVITSGFLIMVFSNFVPTMYFGMLTGLAMVAALCANLLMLPMLVQRFKPMGEVT